MKKKFTLLLLGLFTFMGFAQESNQIIQQFLENNKQQYSLTDLDIQEWRVTNEVYSERSGLTHVYIQQMYQGIPIYNAVANISIKDGNVIHHGMSFVKDIALKANPNNPNITPESAIQRVALQMNLGSTGTVTLIETKSPIHFIYNQGGISDRNIPVELMYQFTENESLRLSWKLSVLQKDGTHWWDVRLDANTGSILDQNDWMVNCQFDIANGTHDHSHAKAFGFPLERSAPIFTGETYNVFAIPVESPNHGGRSLITDAFTTNASPFGWHDTDGAAGPEFTITRGNNVFAKLDEDGSNATVGFSPDGGVTLNFDFPLDRTLTPDNYTSASVTNLFYVNNIMHDIMYEYGFDEASGNFQQNNYGNGGQGGDFVWADAQDASARNNATFGTPPDGFVPTMQMHIFDRNDLLTINTGSLAGSYSANDSNFNDGAVPPSQSGAPLLENPVTADLIVVDDGTAAPTEACSDIVNDLTGKIAVIRRGNCTFVRKIQRAQAQGAVGVIMVNNVAGGFSMGGETTDIMIPAISVTQDVGDPIFAALANSETINVTMANLGNDSSFDNGIIAHEYGHGISNRLIGGANTTSCMGNPEQLGEGWSDFFGLIITMEPGDAEDDIRGVGTFAVNQPVTGTGIRQFPYTTDMAVNPFTFDDVQFQTIQGDVSVHGVGSIWATMLWDLNWAMIDEHGWDPDIYNGTGGNNKTLELVIEGLKLTPCNSGFIGARDAILAADEAINGGENACLIWSVFARRGLGFSATGGSPFLINDQVEAFDLPPSNVLNCALSVEDENFENFSIYPNPSNGNMSISVVNNIENAKVTIYDLSGRIVYAERMDISGTANINTGKLATGVYILKINNGTVDYSQKIIIE